MKGTTAVAATLLSLSAPERWAHATEYLEPSVHRLPGLLPPSVCKQLIELGEKSGFLVETESIDETEQDNPDEEFIPSQTINVYLKGWKEPGVTIPKTGPVVRIEDEAIWSALQPWIPRIVQVVKDHRNEEEWRRYFPDESDLEPVLNWVFFRKYSPNDKRNSLKHHVDTNMATVNIELSDEYSGGGLFYTKPSAHRKHLEVGKYCDQTNGYDWINSMKRQNTTNIVFPELRAGDAIFYNYTLCHGVAPVESGTRYSMAFFFNMDNPAVYDDLLEFEIEFHNELPDVELDVILVFDAQRGDNVWELLFESVMPDERIVYKASEGDILQVLIAGTDQEVDWIEIHPDQSRYAVRLSHITHSSEL